MATKPEVQTKSITEEEYLALGSDVNAEIIDGELVIMSPNRGQHGKLAIRIAGFLLDFADARNLGHVFGDSTAFVLRENPDHSLRDSKVPDLSYVSYERLPEDAELDVLLRLAPNLAIEIISPSERARDVVAKTRFYLEHNVEEVWLVFPDDQEIHVFTPANPLGTTFGINDILTSEDALPGLSVPVRAIFDTQAKELIAATKDALRKTDE